MITCTGRRSANWIKFTFEDAAESKGRTQARKESSPSEELSHP